MPPRADRAREVRRIKGGKVLRDALLLLVILGLGLPYVVSNVGDVPLSAGQEELSSAARKEAYRQEEWLSNSLTHKVVEVVPEDEGIRFRESYYTVFGLPWGWSEVTVGTDEEFTQVKTGLSLGGLF